MLIQEQNKPIVLTKQDIKDITHKVARFPEKTGCAVSSTVKHFVNHIKEIYGIELNILTEEMHNDIMAKEAREERKRSSKLGRKSSRSRPDDF